MWALESSLLKWLDYLEKQGAACEGLDYCRKCGDITIGEGLRIGSKDSSFQISWLPWVFVKTYDDSSSSLRSLLLSMSIDHDDDCAVSRSYRLLSVIRSKLSDDDTKAILDKIACCSRVRSHALSDDEKRYVRSKNG